MTEHKTRKTSSTVDFFAKYKDPRWQKKRLEVMQHAGFRCESCESEEKTLNVHHKSYKKNHNPWDYKIYELECLCEDCHSEKHGIKDRLTDALHDFKVCPCFENPDEELLGFLDGKLTVAVIESIPTSYEYLRGYCAAHLLDVDEINKDGKLDEIIDANNGFLDSNMFCWAFMSCTISEKWHAEYEKRNIVTGVYSHYPSWLMEQILKQVAQVLEDDTTAP